MAGFDPIAALMTAGLPKPPQLRGPLPPQRPGGVYGGGLMPYPPNAAAEAMHGVGQILEGIGTFKQARRQEAERKLEQLQSDLANGLVSPDKVDWAKAGRWARASGRFDYLDFNNQVSAKAAGPYVSPEQALAMPTPGVQAESSQTVMPPTQQIAPQQPAMMPQFNQPGYWNAQSGVPMAEAPITTSSTGGPPQAIMQQARDQVVAPLYGGPPAEMMPGPPQRRGWLGRVGDALGFTTAPVGANSPAVEALRGAGERAYAGAQMRGTLTNAALGEAYQRFQWKEGARKLLSMWMLGRDEKGNSLTGNQHLSLTMLLTRMPYDPESGKPLLQQMSGKDWSYMGYALAEQGASPEEIRSAIKKGIMAELGVDKFNQAYAASAKTLGELGYEGGDLTRNLDSLWGGEGLASAPPQMNLSKLLQIAKVADQLKTDHPLLSFDKRGQGIVLSRLFAGDLPGAYRIASEFGTKGAYDLANTERGLNLEQGRLILARQTENRLATEQMERIGYWRDMGGGRQVYVPGSDLARLGMEGVRLYLQSIKDSGKAVDVDQAKAAFQVASNYLRGTFSPVLRDNKLLIMGPPGVSGPEEVTEQNVGEVSNWLFGRFLPALGNMSGGDPMGALGSEGAPTNLGIGAAIGGFVSGTTQRLDDAGRAAIERSRRR